MGSFVMKPTDGTANKGYLDFLVRFGPASYSKSFIIHITGIHETAKYETAPAHREWAHQALGARGSHPRQTHMGGLGARGIKRPGRPK